MGHDVRTAYDGSTAIDLAREFTPEAALLDVGLPGMNGYDVAKELRRGANGSAVTLVAFTGYGQDEDRRRALQAGFDHHLVKPVDPHVLKRIFASIPSTSRGRLNRARIRKTSPPVTTTTSPRRSLRTSCATSLRRSATLFT